ncbi:hypothetical protein [Oscillibacter sp.]|uniref:hypothetical protein n=1 Tax=Oscillibacter sp. TaxID=1945593 RepID=UPI002899EAFE|nr:hypothetical protein [Oscillibacter sp.]
MGDEISNLIKNGAFSLEKAKGNILHAVDGFGMNTEISVAKKWHVLAPFTTVCKNRGKKMAVYRHFL